MIFPSFVIAKYFSLSKIGSSVKSVPCVAFICRSKQSWKFVLSDHEEDGRHVEGVERCHNWSPFPSTTFFYLENTAFDFKRVVTPLSQLSTPGVALDADVFITFSTPALCRARIFSSNSALLGYGICSHFAECRYRLDFDAFFTFYRRDIGQEVTQHKHKNNFWTK